MKLFAPLAVIFGLALLTALIAYFGFSSVLQALVSSRWGTALVIIARALAVGRRRDRLVVSPYATASRTLHFRRPAVYPRGNQRAVSVRRRRRRYHRSQITDPVRHRHKYGNCQRSHRHFYPGRVPLDLCGGRDRYRAGSGRHAPALDHDLRDVGHRPAGRQRVLSGFEFRRFRTARPPAGCIRRKTRLGGIQSRCRSRRPVCNKSGAIIAACRHRS